MDRQELNRLIDEYALAYAEDYSHWKETGEWVNENTNLALQSLNDYLDLFESREIIVQDCLNNFQFPEDCYEGIYDYE